MLKKFLCLIGLHKLKTHTKEVEEYYDDCYVIHTFYIIKCERCGEVIDINSSTARGR